MLIGLVYWLHFSWFLLVIPVFVFKALIIYGSATIRAGFFLPVRCRGNTSEKKIAITFDDGPVENTARILDVLKQYQVPAAFFCIGKRMETQAQLLQRIHMEGHIVANHSYSHHFFFDFFSKNRLRKELRDTADRAEASIHKQLKLFRPPYGVTTPALAKAITQEGYTAVGWSLRSMDTVAKDRDKLMKKITDVKPGDIVLFHDTIALTAQVLPVFIESVRKKGFEIVSLEQLLNIDAYGKN